MPTLRALSRGGFGAQGHFVRRLGRFGNFGASSTFVFPFMGQEGMLPSAQVRKLVRDIVSPWIHRRDPA